MRVIIETVYHIKKYKTKAYVINKKKTDSIFIERLEIAISFDQFV